MQQIPPELKSILKILEKNIGPNPDETTAKYIVDVNTCTVFEFIPLFREQRDRMARLITKTAQLCGYTEQLKIGIAFDHPMEAGAAVPDGPQCADSTCRAHKPGLYYGWAFPFVMTDDEIIAILIHEFWHLKSAPSRSHEEAQQQEREADDYVGKLGYAQAFISGLRKTEQYEATGEQLQREALSPHEQQKLGQRIASLRAQDYHDPTAERIAQLHAKYLNQ